MVQIKDRRLGILSLLIQTIIALYIVGSVTTQSREPLAHWVRFGQRGGGGGAADRAPVFEHVKMPRSLPGP